MEPEKKICSCCKNKEVGKTLRLLCDSCYKLNGQKRRGFNTGNFDPGVECHAGRLMIDSGRG